jgi:hypothetical protein
MFAHIDRIEASAESSILMRHLARSQSVGEQQGEVRRRAELRE